MTEAGSPERWEVHFEGRVQGVGFRYTTRMIALRFPVSGYVRNLRDGRVLLIAEGEPGPLQDLLEAVEAEMGRHIRRTTRNAVPATGEFAGCVSSEGIHDINGNLWEWIQGDDLQVKGGAYNCGDSATLHACTYSSPAAYRSAVGFRCCSDL